MATWRQCVQYMHGVGATGRQQWVYGRIQHRQNVQIRCGRFGGARHSYIKLCVSWQLSGADLIDYSGRRSAHHCILQYEFAALYVCRISTDQFESIWLDTFWGEVLKSPYIVQQILILILLWTITGQKSRWNDQNDEFNCVVEQNPIQAEYHDFSRIRTPFRQQFNIGRMRRCGIHQQRIRQSLRIHAKHGRVRNEKIRNETEVSAQYICLLINYIIHCCYCFGFGNVLFSAALDCKTNVMFFSWQFMLILAVKLFVHGAQTA